MAVSAFSQFIYQASRIAEEWGPFPLWIASLAVSIALLGGVYILISRKQARDRIHVLKEAFLRRRQLEEHLCRSQKLKSQGVFHDFNNLFQIIMGYAELGQMDSDNPAATAEFLEQIVSSTEKARDLSKHLTSLGYRNLTNLKRLDLDEFLTTHIPVLEHSTGDKNTIRFSFECQGEVIYGTPGQLKQLLQDLTDNGRDAMPGGGEIVVKTRKVSVPDTDSENGLRDYIQLSCKDTGPGIPGKHLDHIFDPFFTHGKGPEAVGLGLATVSSIVEAHGGYIEVDSKKGEGTTFRIYFPIITKLGKADEAGSAVSSL